MTDSSKAPLPPITNKWQFIYYLTTGKLQYNSLWASASYRYKFLLRSLFTSQITLSWLDKLRTYPCLEDYMSCQTNLPCKLQRPYLSSCMNKKEGFQALAYHYDFLSQQPSKVSKAFYNKDKPFDIAELTGKNDYRVRFAVQSRNKYAREGELSLYLIDDLDGIAYSILTFSVIEYQNKPTLFIGGLQSFRGEHVKSRVQQLTKACYGLQPKRLTIEAILLVARYFKLEQIIAVGTKTHVYNNWRYNKRQQHVYFDYDEFWRTFDAEKNTQSLYQLPLTLTRKPIDEIASKKRSEYKNRYTLLDQLADEIQQRLTELTQK